MKITSEISPMTIGVDNAITKALASGKWGIRLSFLNDIKNSRYEMVLTPEEAQELIHNLNKSLSSLASIPEFKMGN